MNRIELLREGIDLCYQLADAMEQQDIQRAKELNVQVTGTGLYIKSEKFREIQSALLSFHPDVKRCQNGYLNELRSEIDDMLDG